MIRVIVPLVTVAGLLAGTPQTPLRWTAQVSGTTARLRGVSAVSDQVVWASGNAGTVVRSADGGASWKALKIPNAEGLDFRDIDALDERTAFVLSIGPGDQSRIYRTDDGGDTWVQQFVNRDPKAFYDAMTFSGASHGYAFSDSVDGQFVVLRTDNGGRQWVRLPAGGLPAALPGEGAFAASGTNVAVVGRDHVWIGTGAAPQARVLRSTDGGRTWSISTTPLAAGATSGIFSIAFKDPSHGIVVGGDFQKEAAALDNAAITTDGGATWTAVTGLGGFRSAVAWVPGKPSTVIAVGPGGTDISTDGGRTWTAIPGPGYHALSVSPTGRYAWGVGEKGTVGQLTLD
jgi:photosystem II stability/assembly factor-like uncharacterized protein